MYIRCQQYKSRARQAWRREHNNRFNGIRAELVRNVRINGKPRMIFVAYLGYFHEGWPPSTQHCLQRARKVLKRLKLKPQERDKIMAKLAKRFG